MKNIMFYATILAAGFSSSVHTAELQPTFIFSSSSSSYDSSYDEGYARSGSLPESPESYDSDHLAERYDYAKERKENYRFIGYNQLSVKSIDLSHTPFCITGSPAKITRGFGSEATVSRVSHVSKKYKCPKKDDSEPGLALIPRKDVDNFPEDNDKPKYYGIEESPTKKADPVDSRNITTNDHMVFMSILFGQEEEEN